MENKPARQQLRYDLSNDKVRIDSHTSLDPHFAAALMAFYRHIDSTFVYDEQVVPAMAEDGNILFSAVRDRAWPPWGLGAKQVGAVCQVQRVGERKHTITPMHVSDNDRANIGLLAGMYKQALEAIMKLGSQLCYFVAEGAVLADRTLRRYGFCRGSDVVYSGEHPYVEYVANPAKLLEEVALDKLSLPELLAHEIDADQFQRITGLLLAIQVAAGPTHRDLVRPELLRVVTGAHWDTPPAQVPPPISRGPGKAIELPTEALRPARGKR